MLIKHALKERKNDLYESPAEAVQALLKIEALPHWIWEPAAGRGAIAKVLCEAGYAVVTHDLVDYPGLDASGRDFLFEREAPRWCETIVTNPPYKLAAEFVRHGLKLCPTVIMLLRLTFLESESRSDIIDGGQLARVHVFRKRIPGMHRDGWEGPKVTNTVCFAWFVWEREHNGKITMDRI